MVPPEYTKKVFDMLGSEKKRYFELDGAEHFPTQKKYYKIWADETDNFIRRL